MVLINASAKPGSATYRAPPGQVQIYQAQAKEDKRMGAENICTITDGLLFESHYLAHVPLILVVENLPSCISSSTRLSEKLNGLRFSRGTNPFFNDQSHDGLRC